MLPASLVRSKCGLTPTRVPITPITPLASYDMEKIGLSGCVTARSWNELHDPASTSLSLKLFSSANVGNTTSANKRLTLADTDGVINVGDSLQEISDMADFSNHPPCCL